MAARTTKQRGQRPPKKQSKGDPCAYCKIPGHKEEDCYRKKREEKEKKAERKAGGKHSNTAAKAKASNSDDDSESASDTPVAANVACTSTAYNTVFVSANLAAEDLNEVNVDSGASHHLTPNLIWFERGTIRKLALPLPITTADGKVIYATKEGTLLFDVVGEGGVVTRGQFERTLYVPDLATTLISVTQLTRQHRHRLIFEGNNCNIISESTNRIVATAQRSKSNLYRLVGTPVVPHSTERPRAHIASVDINVLHERLGHLGHQNVQRLIRENLVTGVGTITGTPQFCEACVGGKQHRLPFPPRTALKASRKLEIVHSDVCGPFPTSLGGNKYFVTFIDH